MIRTLLATSALVIGGSAAPAFAAGPTPVVEPVVAPPPPPPPGVDWTGGYVGAQLGWGWASGDTSVDLDPFGVFDEDADADLDGDGAIGGFSTGYRYDFGRFVLGGELQYDMAAIDFDELDIDGDDFDLEVDLDDDAGSIDEIWRAKMTAGFEAGPALVYGSFGYAHATAEIGGDDIDGDGWVVGAGADYLVRENITVGGEVMYHQFDDFATEGNDIDATTVQAKVTFRF